MAFRVGRGEATLNQRAKHVIYSASMFSRRISQMHNLGNVAKAEIRAAQGFQLWRQIEYVRVVLIPLNEHP